MTTKDKLWLVVVLLFFWYDPVGMLKYTPLAIALWVLGSIFSKQPASTTGAPEPDPRRVVAEVMSLPAPPSATERPTLTLPTLKEERMIGARMTAREEWIARKRARAE